MDAKRKVRNKIRAAPMPSPVPKTNLILADIALRGGSMLLRRGVERGLLGAKYTPSKAKQVMKKRSIFDALTSTAIAKLATRSVPGAIVVSGGLLAKTLYDRRKARKAQTPAPPATQMGDWESDEDDDDEA